MKNHFYQNVRFSKSLNDAVNGLKLIIKNERNFRIDIGASIVVVVVGLLFNISHFDWIALTLLIALVFISETINSVIEALCDTVSTEYKVNIKYAKDVSAGAVLVSSIVSVIAGLMIFMPYIITYLTDIMEGL
jgi:diacylglycerol kinase